MAVDWAPDHDSALSACYCSSKQAKPDPSSRAVGFGQRFLHAELQDISGKLTAGILASGDDEVIDVGDGATLERSSNSDFLAFRKSLGVTEADYHASMTGLSGGATQDSGKSGSLFWFSSDNKYMIKSISTPEYNKLIAILPEYLAHFTAAQKEGRVSLLAKFYGAYCLQVDTQAVHFIAMNNVFSSGKPSRAYDLKGTTEDRYVEPGDGKVMKDSNFEDAWVGLPERDADQIHRAVDADTAFLEEHGIMDYSLILGVYDQAGPNARNEPATYSGLEVTEDEESEAKMEPATFRIGIVDILVEYSLKKKLAHVMKKTTIGCCHEIDTEPPQRYRERFVDAMEEKVNVA